MGSRLLPSRTPTGHSGVALLPGPLRSPDRRDTRLPHRHRQVRPTSRPERAQAEVVVNPTDSNKARNHPTEAELETKLRRTFQAVGRAALGASSADVAPLRRSTLHYMAYRRRRLGVATLTAVSVVAAL